MKKYILTSLIALMYIVSASASQKLCLKENVNGVTKTYILDITKHDTIFHNDSLRQVHIKTGNRSSYLKQGFSLDAMSQISFLDSEKASGSISALSECKLKGETLFVNDSLATYQYIEKEKTLKLTLFYNGGDCCADWFVDMLRSGDTISLFPGQYRTEDPENPGVYLMCDCMCAYDLTILLSDVEPGKYHFIAGFDKKEFDIDLTQGASGVVLDGPRGVFMQNSPCKSNNDLEEEAQASTESNAYSPRHGYVKEWKDGDTLLTYRYEPLENLILFVSHDVELNCCASISSETIVRNDTIFVNSVDLSNAPCNCNCVYDVTSRVENLKIPRGHGGSLLHFVVDGVPLDIEAKYFGEGEAVSGAILYGSPRGYTPKPSTCGVSFEEEEGDPKFEKLTRKLESSVDTLVSYRFDPQTGSGTVYMHDMPLNCCIEASSITKVKDSVVYITPVEIGNPCRCICQYNITTIVENLGRKVYHFSIPRASETIEFDVDLTRDTIVEGAILNVIRGVFNLSSECKKQRDQLSEEEMPVTSSEKVYPNRPETLDTLVYYQYFDGQVFIESYGLELNCCTDKGSEVVAQGDTIIVNATESGERCRCLCIFDISTNVLGVSKKKYHFIVDGVEFDVDFSKDLSGFVTR